ncbi:MAG: hypothetical protein F6K47_14660 [Symploca sp. SIO2E6]|nr:hypothetical protein [Symploca sp. SIO2E6]
MNHKRTSTLLSLIAASLAALNFNSSSALSQNQSNPAQTNTILKQGEAYYCDEKLEHPTVVFRSDLGNARLIQFQREGNEDWYDDNPEWTPLNRCRDIAQRALEFDKLDIISYLTKEWMEEKKVWAICISKIDADHLQLLELMESDPDNPDLDTVRLLLTLKPSDTPDEILEQIKGISSISKDGKPLIH